MLIHSEIYRFIHLPTGRRVKEINKEFIITTTKKGRKSTTKKRTKNVEFEEDGDLKIKSS